MKDRVESSLRENMQRVRALEVESDQQKNQMMTRDEVERLIGERLE